MESNQLLTELKKYPKITVFTSVILSILFLGLLGYISATMKEREATQENIRTQRIQEFHDKYGEEDDYYFCNNLGFLTKAYLSESNREGVYLIKNDNGTPTVCPNWTGKN